MSETLFVVSYPPRMLDKTLPFLVVGAVALAGALWSLKRRQLWRSVILVVWGAGWGGTGTIVSVSHVRRHAELYEAYSEGECVVVEGVVHLEHVQPAAGHALGDVVRLGSESFVIDRFRWTPGYKRTIAYGGVLREGESMRVWLYAGEVLRIDRVALIRSSETGSHADR